MDARGGPEDRSPLFLAALAKRWDVCAWLLSVGASKILRDRQGLTAYQAVAGSSDPEVREHERVVYLGMFTPTLADWGSRKAFCGIGVDNNVKPRYDDAISYYCRATRSGRQFSDSRVLTQVTGRAGMLTDPPQRVVSVTCRAISHNSLTVVWSDPLRSYDGETFVGFLVRFSLCRFMWDAHHNNSNDRSSACKCVCLCPSSVVKTPPIWPCIWNVLTCAGDCQ